MSKLGSVEDFKEKLLQYDKMIVEKQNKDWEYRNNNKNAWKRVETELMGSQGTYRSQHYNAYKMYSEFCIPMGSTMHDDLIKGMTDAERKAIGK